MHGLINTAIQSFIRHNYGTPVWAQVCARLEMPTSGFEAMLKYDDAVTERLIGATSITLARPRTLLLEDIGAFIAMTHPLRRLLRFGGASYHEFLLSLDELPARARMCLPDIGVPELSCATMPDGSLRLRVVGDVVGWGAFMCGLVRAVADDYGALAVIDYLGSGQENGAACELVQILLLDQAFSEGMQFDLAQEADRPSSPSPLMACGLTTDAGGRGQKYG
ncbi:heme NO-binding protein [Rhodobacteraceae bacterium]|nr:heme NO-binding protein [Paracoccaceae bacterium]